MSITALVLVLLAALIHATWNYHLKKANAGRALWLLVYIFTTLISIPALVIADPECFSRITPTGWLVICISAPVHTLYAVTLQTGYRKADYSIVYPTARGSGPMISVLAAVLILGNSPSLGGALGIASILCGIVLLSLKAESPEGGRSKVRAGLVWGTLTGLCIAGYTFCDAWAVQQNTGLTPASFYFPSIALRVVCLAPFVLLARDGMGQIRDVFSDPVKRKALAVVTAGSPGAYILVLYAMTMAPLAYVAPTREVGMMVGVLFGAALLKEKLSPARLAGIAAMVSGVALIALSK